MAAKSPIHSFRQRRTRAAVAFQLYPSPLRGAIEAPVFALARAQREEKRSIDLDFPRSLYLSVCRSGVGAIAADCDVTGEMGPPSSCSLSLTWRPRKATMIAAVVAERTAWRFDDGMPVRASLGKFSNRLVSGDDKT